MKSFINLIFSVIIALAGISCSKATAEETKSSFVDAGAITTAITLNNNINDASLVCPPEMVEVKGNYCSEVQETCLEYDETVVNVNGKVRCMRFAPSKCLSQKRKYLHFCMDKLEYQRDKTDPLPTVMVSFNEMQQLAKQENKRLCYDYEWEFACMGEELRPYPTGWTREPDKCNIDKTPIAFNELALANPATRDAEVKHLSQRTPANSNPECASPFGILNMSGNVDEILINTDKSVKHKNTLKGGYWNKGARSRCSPRTDVHDENFAFYQLGTRLCKDIN